jgi:hypothetical protein
MQIPDIDEIVVQEYVVRTRMNDVRDVGIHFGPRPKLNETIFSRVPVPASSL